MNNRKIQRIIFEGLGKKPKPCLTYRGGSHLQSSAQSFAAKSVAHDPSVRSKCPTLR